MATAGSGELLNPLILRLMGSERGPVHHYESNTFVKRLRDAGMVCILRPPHTTHVTQGEDTIHFGPFKSNYAKTKMKLLTEKRLRGAPAELKLADFPECFAEPWEHAFRREKVIEAWSKDGVFPFTRRCYWDVLQKEESQAEAAARVGAQARAQSALHTMRANTDAIALGGRNQGGGASQNPHGDEDTDLDEEDEDDEAGGAEGRASTITGATARIRGAVAHPSVRAAVEDFTQSEDQVPLS